MGASAGSISALLLAHALLTGKGAEDQRTLWVDKADLEVLLKKGRIPDRPDAPLSPKSLLDWASVQLVPGDRPVQKEPIYLVMSIANLQGLTFRLAMRSSEQAIRADTYRDAAVFVMRPESSAGQWRDAMIAAAASSANGLGFSAVRLERAPEEYPPEIDWPPGASSFWYTDGGTVYNEPFGMALDAVYSPRDLSPVLEERDLGTNDRLFLLIHPHPADPLSPWPPGAREMPLFAQSSLRAFNMQRAQSLYDDLLKVEKYNGRLRWRAALEKVMADHDLAETEWIRTLAEEVSADREARHRLTKREAIGPGERPPHPTRPPLEAILDAATGTAGKQPAYVEVVGPDVDPRVRSGAMRITDLLAGERLRHFLGFASEEARKSDFRLGYENFTTWWVGDGGLVGFRSKTGFGPLDVPGHECLQWPWRGDFSLSNVSRGKRLRWAFKLVPRYLKAFRSCAAFCI